MPHLFVMKLRKLVSIRLNAFGEGPLFNSMQLCVERVKLQTAQRKRQYPHALLYQLFCDRNFLLFFFLDSENLVPSRHISNPRPLVNHEKLSLFLYVKRLQV
jgi:hypothetical protein